MKTGIRAWLAVLVLLAAGLPGHAAGPSSGFSQATEAAPTFQPEQVIQMAKKVEKALAAKGARVALVARIGRPASEMPPGMRYTHVGFAVYSDITTQDGRHVPGYAMYNSYQNDAQPDTSSLVQDYPVDFFAGVAALEAGIIIPSAELQRRLLEVIASPTYKALHDPHYSAIANPYTLGRQNCTEFVLDVVQAAIYQTSDIRRIKATEKTFFEAQPVNFNPLKLLLGALFMAEVSMSDHPGSPVTATFETIGAYLKKYDQGSELFLLAPE